MEKEDLLLRLKYSDKVLIDAAMGWSKTESSPVSETNPPLVDDSVPHVNEEVALSSHSTTNDEGK